MHKIVERIENSRISVKPWIASFFAIALIRMIIESFSSNGFTIFSFQGLFFEPPFYFATVSLSLGILMHILTKVEMKKILNITLYGFLISPLVPIVDFIISGGSGNITQLFLFKTLPDLAWAFLTFFGPNLTSGATYGLRFAALLAMVGCGYYVFTKTRKISKTIIGVFGAYFSAFVIGSLPSYFAIFGSLPKNPWKVTAFEMTQKFLTPRDIFSMRFGPEKIIQLLNTEITLILIPIACMLLLATFYLWDKKKFLAFWKKIRLLRLLLHYFAVIVGILIALYVYKTPFTVSFFEILTLLNLFIIITCIWIFSLTTNDKNDIAIDIISNQERLLVTKEYAPEEFTMLATISFVIAGFASYTLGETFAVLTLGNFALAYAYSYPPLRLRRFPLVAPIMMSMGIALLVFLGFLPFAPSGSFADFPVPILALLILCAALCLNVKDVKDIEGDSKNGVYTIPTIFGDRLGKIIISLFYVLAYLLFPIVLHNKAIVLPAILFAIFTWLIVNVKKVHEWHVFGIFFFFLIVVAVTIT